MPEQDERLAAELREYYRRLAEQPAPDVLGRVMMATDLRTARLRRWAAVGGGLAAAAVVGGVVAVALVTHNHNQTTGVAPGHSATGAPTAAATPTPPTSTPTPAPVVPVGAPAHGFVPTDVTAVSASQWWVLGYNGPTCVSASCTRILHTVDSGQTFTSIPTPAVAPASSGQRDDRLRFAGPLDGWLVSSGGNLWQTHDGGASWAEDNGAGSVTDLEASGGAVYAVACASRSNCALEHSGTAADSWSTLVASAGHGALGGLDVNGAHVWVSLNSPAGGPGTILASSDGGTHFATETVCPGALGFPNVYAVDSTVLWAVCATGTEAQAFRSVDSGQQFAPIPGSVMIPNFATIAGVSSTTAVIAGQGLQRTSNGGQSFTSAEASQAQWSIVGFTTAQNGFAFQRSGQAQMWRTDDAGAHWHQVQFP